MKGYIKISRYVFTDYLFSAGVWALYFLWRQYLIYHQLFLDTTLFEPFFWIGILGVPLFWLALYLLAGHYAENLYEKSRLNELTHVFITHLAGTTVIFFAMLLDDIEVTIDTGYYYKSFASLFALQTFFILWGRFFWLSIVKRQIARGEVRFTVWIAGNGAAALKAWHSIKEDAPTTGWHVAGYLATPETEKGNLQRLCPCLGAYTRLSETATHGLPDKIVIALDKDSEETRNIISYFAESDTDILIVPGMMDILTGSVRSSGMVKGLFIQLHTNPLEGWQQNTKRLIDVVVSLLAAILLSPLIIFTALRIRLDSKGPVLYRQVRTGYKGKPFTILKFRSMVENAEPDGPALSSDNDPRITPWGRTMRKWRLDELPQLWNILKGDMSLVGPRPERQYFIDKIKTINPYYSFLLKVKPGLTSWGMVQYGYASSVAQMLERMQYDLTYVENASLLLDFKIMMQTIRIIFSGKGK